MSDKKNIYAKLAEARAAFHRLDLKKSGENKFAGYRYFELGDFVQPGLSCMADAGLCPVVTFEPERAVMRIFETDGDGCIEIESPRAGASLKGCHPIQNLGAEETYQRRYLWMAALEIVEHDAVDASKPAEAPAKTVTEKQAAEIKALISELGEKLNRGAFDKWLIGTLKVPNADIARIPAAVYRDVVKMLERKRPES